MKIINYRNKTCKKSNEYGVNQINIFRNLHCLLQIIEFNFPKYEIKIKIIAPKQK